MSIFSYNISYKEEIMANININQSINLDEVLAVAIGKALKFKKVQFESDEEIQKFLTDLYKDEDFLNALKKMIKVAD